MSPSFDAARAERLIAERAIAVGTPLVFSPVTGSTNDDALAAARSGAPHGATFVADLQTHGRGRRGAQWFAPEGEDLTFSVLLYPELEPSSAAGLTLAVGLAVRDACARRITAPVDVKWPNDVWVQGDKLAGILLESSLQGGKPSTVVVGVGINVFTLSFPDDLAHPATSLARAGAAQVTREDLLVDALEQIARRTAEFARDGLGLMLEEFSRHDALAGRRVEVDGRAGIGDGIDASGALRIRDDAGAVLLVTSGTVTLK